MAANSFMITVRTNRYKAQIWFKLNYYAGTITEVKLLRINKIYSTKGGIMMLYLWWTSVIPPVRYLVNN